MVPVAGVGHAPTTAFATTEAYTLSPGPPNSVPVSGSLVPKQLGGRGLESSPTVSDYAVLTIVVANSLSFSTCLWPPIVYYRPCCPMP